MKNLFFSRQTKMLVDILLIFGLILLLSAGHIRSTSETHWNSAHCIIGSVLSLLIVVHVAQHWRFIKAFTKQKVVLKNKITAVTIICFVLILTTIIFFIAGTSLLKLHNVIGHLFILIIIIHAIDKSKRFISFFRR